MEIQSKNALAGNSDREKAAYIGALAALATADREATQEELEHLRELSQAAGVSPEQEQQIIHAATDVTGQDLKKNLDILKSSSLRYSLITDLIALAKSDDSYTEEEKTNIQKVAQYLDVNRNQFSVLDQYVDKAAEAEHTPEEVTRPGFLDSLGLRDRFKQAGFDSSSMGKNLFGFLGPVLLGGLAARALTGSRRGGIMGSAMGGMLPGGMGGFGGLGPLIRGMNRSRSSNAMGGLLGRLL